MDDEETEVQYTSARPIVMHDPDPTAPAPAKRRGKGISKTALVTVDATHREFMDEFARDEQASETMQAELARVTEHVQAPTFRFLSLDDQMALQKRQWELQHALFVAERRKHEYLHDNALLLREYFDTKRNQTTGRAKSAMADTSKSMVFKHFFEPKSSVTAVAEEVVPVHAPEEVSARVDRRSVVQKYLANVSDDFLDAKHFTYSADVCGACTVGDMMVLEDEGVKICSHCCRSVPFLSDHEKPPYKEPPKEVCYYAYKRINHFKEILAQCQGKETTRIPADTITRIQLQIQKERLRPSQLSNKRVREMLKKLGLNKLYEHIPYIKSKLGIPPPVMTAELEDKLCALFVEIQAPYIRHMPKDRANFLNYYYVAFKLCELIGETSYLEHFRMLKEEDKRVEQDAIWRKICADMNWIFHVTL